MVLTTGEGCEFVHGALNDSRNGVVVLVHGLTTDEVDIRILSGTADGWAIRGQGALAMGNDQILINHGAHIVHGQFFDLHNLMGGTEAVEEMEEGNAGSKGGLGGDQSHVLALLNILGTQHGPAGLTGSHNIAVVTED